MEKQKWRAPSPIWIIVIICGALAFGFNVIQIQTYSMNMTYLTAPRQKLPTFSEEMRMKGYTIRTPGCTIPDMNPMDASVKEYIFREEEVVCNNGTPALFESNLTSLYILDSSLSFYNINDTDLLKCCYQAFHREDPLKNDADNNIIFDKKCKGFKTSSRITDEFIRVKCKYNNSEIYKDFFDFVPLKNESKERTPDSDRLNVLVIGVDAVSRLNLHRQMPLTVNYLMKLKAVQMMGYNKVGDNTFPNLIPVLTGLSEDELVKKCWPSQNVHFDKCPFIWKLFNEAGYTTAFGEDSAWMGLFLYTKRGFKKQPTDYYWDHFNYMAEKQIGNAHRLNVNQCVGSRSVYKVLLNYISKFSRTMHDYKKKFFAFFWGASLSHDFLNKPSLGDGDYVNILQEFNETGILNNTALIFMSDHGIRWGSIRSTYQGRMEERLPFLYIGLPDWYVKQNSLLIDNLKTNTRRLTTPFDLHETLKDLLSSTNLTDEFLDERASNLGIRRAYSLFDKIGKNRTCKSAGISAHWCTCQDSTEISATDSTVLEAANYTINEYINEMLVGYADCAVLELKEVINARVQTNNEHLQKSHYSKDYTITFRTNPGGAIFESTIRKYVSPNEYHFNVTGTVSRINLYGKQSLCITDFHLKLYCYCKNFIPND